MRARSGRRRVARWAAGSVGVSACLLGLAAPAGAPPQAASAPAGADGPVASVPAGALTAGDPTGSLVPGGTAGLLGAPEGGGSSGPAAPVVLARSEPTGVVVPALGLDADLMSLGLQPDGAMEVPPDASSVGWFTGAPTPGERGPAVIAAHVDWAGRSGPFAELETLEPGDEIRVRRSDGATVAFVVDRVGRYPKDRFPTEEVYGDIDHAGLRLITCGGAFDRGTRSYEDNVVVFASLRA